MGLEADRRGFLKGTAAGAAALAAAQESSAQPAMKMAMQTPQTPGDYPRMHAGAGGAVGSPTDRGKLVAGYRKPGLAPVPLEQPDLEKLAHRMVDGAKEFVLRCELVRVELLPDFWMDSWGFNGRLPGPTIEVQQGDRVRIIVENRLPEPTSMHWHGLEIPVAMDGVPGLNQDLIPPGGRFVYEFTLHQEGTYFYHAHVSMQEAMGMAGLFVIHPKVAFDPTVDRDFGLILQQFSIGPNQTIPNSQAMDWNFLTINGKCGPLTTPLLMKLGERVRVRILNFSTAHHHPFHLHGHTFWVNATEGGRMPESAWFPSNNILVPVAQVREFEFIANNQGDWIAHCHMFHHVMNHMASQVGPHIRSKNEEKLLETPGWPQLMQGMAMSPSQMKKINGRREVRGMRSNWFTGVHGMATVFRVLPESLYHQIVHTDDSLPPGVNVPGSSNAPAMKM